MSKFKRVSFERKDIENIIVNHRGNAAFLENLTVADDRMLIRIIGRYIHFNSVFGGGVANLAGKIAEQRQMFQDRSASVHALRDRSSVVAADVFFAAIDEFGDRALKSKFTHRTLAQATLNGIYKYFGFEPRAFNDLVALNEISQGVVEAVEAGYLLDKSIDEMAICHAIGFHVGSEILADEEFRILDSSMYSRFPELTAYLRRAKVQLGELFIPAYHWIQIHTSVEIDHFNFAVKSANSALRYYVGNNSKKQIKNWIFDGFVSFSNVQTCFMSHLTEE